MFNRRPRHMFSETFRTSDGHKFFGEFGDPNAAPRPRKEIQNLPHRVLSVSNTSTFVTEGSLVYHHDQGYLLFRQHVLEGVKRFLAAEVNTHLVWSRLPESTDLVTGLPRDGLPVELDARLPLIIEPGRSYEEENFSQDQFRLFAAADIQVGDLLGDMKVSRVVDLLGVRMIEAS